MDKEKFETEFTREALAGRTVFNENLLHVAINQNNVRAVQALIEVNFDPFLKTHARQDAFDLISNQTDLKKRPAKK